MSLQYYDSSSAQLVEQIDLDGVAKESSIQALLAAVQNRGAVKSVQRGKTAVSLSSPYNKNTDVRITAVDTTKSVVIVEQCFLRNDQGTYSSSVDPIAGYLADQNTLRLSYWYSGSGDLSIAWQVIEFY